MHQITEMKYLSRVLPTSARTFAAALPFGGTTNRSSRSKKSALQGGGAGHMLIACSMSRSYLGPRRWRVLLRAVDSAGAGSAGSARPCQHDLYDAADGIRDHRHFGARRAGSRHRWQASHPAKQASHPAKDDRGDGGPRSPPGCSQPPSDVTCPDGARGNPPSTPNVATETDRGGTP